ncbi:24412_t:CDS:2, partial [Dentiscutata erythropus]
NPQCNKCPLKVSLVEVPQKIPIEIKDTEESVIKHLYQTILSIIFVVGQIEIIANELYDYANDINFIDTHFITKKKELPDTELPSTNPIPNPTRYKLLNVHQTIIQNSEVDPENNLPSLKCK